MIFYTTDDSVFQHIPSKEEILKNTKTSGLSDKKLMF